MIKPACRKKAGRFFSLGIDIMIEYENTSQTTLVVVVDGNLIVIAPKEKIKARNVVYTPSLTEIKKVENLPKKQKKRVTNASKTKD